MSGVRLTAEERRWLAKDIPDVDYVEDGDGACPSCNTHAGNVVSTVERILAARLGQLQPTCGIRSAIPAAQPGGPAVYTDPCVLPASHRGGHQDADGYGWQESVR